MKTNWIGISAGVVLGLLLAGLIYSTFPSGDSVLAEKQGNPLTGSSTETVAVGEVVDGIRGLNRLHVFRSYITAITSSAEKQGWGVIESKQIMITPAFVNYFIDLEKISPKDVRLEGKKLTVKIPSLTIERPNVDFPRIKEINEGMLSDVTDADKRLKTFNSKMAMQQLMTRAKEKFFIDAAKKQAVVSMKANIQLILNKAGVRDLEVEIKMP